MNVLSLFSGIAGLDLGIRQVIPEARTVCWVEADPYCRSVLVARMEDGSLDVAPIAHDVRSFDGRPWAGRVDCVSGGFPCQDLSFAGKRAGILEGERSSLWFEYARIVREVRPRFVVVENVPGILTSGLGYVLGPLAEVGFDAEWICVRASDVGAPHRRERVFLLAYRNGAGQQRTCGHLPADPGSPYRDNAGDSFADRVANSCRPRLEERTSKRSDVIRGGQTVERDCGEWPPGPADAEGWGRVLAVRPDLAPALGPSFRRVVAGIPYRVDGDRTKRLKALGNAVVPAQAALALRILFDRIGGR